MQRGKLRVTHVSTAGGRVRCRVRARTRLLEKQIDDLTNGRIKYKKAVDPDDLEEYTVGHRIYLRDVLTDAIYTRHGKLFGYLEEDTGKLVKVRET